MMNQAAELRQAGPIPDQLRSQYLQKTRKGSDKPGRLCSSDSM
jgi:hypothetical protein